MNSLDELFCAVDDFCKVFVPVWQKQMLTTGEIQRQRTRSLNVSEIMTILIHFHQSHYRDFKAYYSGYVLERLRSEFPGLVSYTLFCRVHSICVDAVMRLPATGLLGDMYRHLLYRFNRAQSVSQPEDPFAQGICRPGRAWKDLHGLVLRLQIAPDLQ